MIIESLLLSPLLDEDFGSSNSKTVSTILHRYLMLMGAPKDDHKNLFSTRGRALTKAHIYFYKSYIDDRGIDTNLAVRLNTKDAPVEQYIKKAFGIETRVYQSLQEQYTVICAESSTNFSEVNNAQMMKLLAIYPRLVPWLCPTVTQTDKEVIEALASGNLTELIKVTNRICEEKLGDFRTEKMMKYLSVLQSRTHESELRSLENVIENLNGEVAELMGRIKSKCEDLKTAEKRMALLQMEEVGTGDDLIKFFREHKQLQIVSNMGDKVIVHISEKIEYYDDKELAKQLCKPGTFWYSLSPDTKKVVKYVFIEKKAKLRVTAAFAIDAGMNVTTATLSAYDLPNSMPHPHLDKYHCLGSNSQYLSEFNMRGDWDLAIEQMIAAAKNINIFDRAVMGYMTDYFGSNSRSTIFELPDGSFVSRDQIINLANKEESGEQE